MSWIDALKIYAGESGKYSIPRKNTEAYLRVKAIQEKLKANKQPPKKVQSSMSTISDPSVKRELQVKKKAKFKDDVEQEVERLRSLR